jgi:hypothetical protein
MAQGVFGLKKVYRKQYENVVNKNFSSWPESSTYGYFAGGVIVSTIIRLDFSNETINNPGKNLPSARFSIAATSSISYGYFYGGSFPGGAHISTISRLDFSNETVSDPGNNLSPARGRMAAISSGSYGYLGGGSFPSPVSLSTITRFDFFSETLSNPGKNLPSIRDGLAAVSNDSYGYFGGGLNNSIPARICTISRLDFSNETVNDPGNNLVLAVDRLAATSSSSYGYFGGGDEVGPSPIAVVSRRIVSLDFSNETVSNRGNIFPTARESLAATSNSSYGYFGGGAGSPGAAAATVRRLDLSNETVSDTTNLPSARESLAATSGGQSILRGNKNYGYFGGGYFTSIVSTISRLDFSNETVSNLGKDLPSAILSAGATSSNSYGYFGGGLLSGDPVAGTSLISRLDFSNETVSDPGNNLSIPRGLLAATSSSSYGYFGGGSRSVSNLVRNTTISRLDFSNETVSDPGNNFTLGITALSVTSNNSYGYFGGGATPGLISTISRLDFSNETVNNPGSDLPSARSQFAATSSSSYGYFGGGATPGLISTISRLDFSNETVSNPGSDLPSARNLLAATSSNSYGYYAGGSTPSGVSTIDRLDFSNETVGNPGNNLPTARSYLAALANSN